jgi:NAD(P)-dependent dehydrogenase (short-subunit alcohol dehydrogenase family)
MALLEGKVAVVTGAAGGIGQATVRRFARAGAKLVIADVSDADALAREVAGLFVSTDVSDEEQVEALMGRAAAAHGRIDVVINNAGIPVGGAPLGGLQETHAEPDERGHEAGDPVRVGHPAQVAQAGQQAEELDAEANHPGDAAGFEGGVLPVGLREKV